MAGSPRKRARREAALAMAASQQVHAGFTPGTASVYANGSVFSGKIVDGDGNPVEPDAGGRIGDSDSGGDYPQASESTRAAAPGGARYSTDFRAQTLAIAEDCARLLRIGPDRDTAQVYRSMIEILQRIEAQDPKETTPRPEDVRKGVADMLAMLPDLCANDDELRTLAVEALARVVEQAEG